jgi:hypothetical protein
MLYVGQLHYPVLNKKGEIVSTAVTSMDPHDIARSCRTYGVKTYYLITPLKSQQEIVARIKDYWTSIPPDEAHRAEALKLIKIVDTLYESLEDIEKIEGKKPITVGTSAQEKSVNTQSIGYNQLQAKIEENNYPVYLLFGTGWGLPDQILEIFDYLLDPIRGSKSDYNHLSVRAAIAIILDRLAGR